MVLQNPQRKNGRATAQKSTAVPQRAAAQEQSVPPVTDHARWRWSERAAAIEADIATAWQQSIPVAPPDHECDRARLFPPCDLLFVVEDDVITTVRPANYDTLDTSELGQCGDCGNLAQFGAAAPTCPWCGCAVETVRMENGAVIQFEGGR